MRASKTLPAAFVVPSIRQKPCGAGTEQEWLTLAQMLGAARSCCLCSCRQQLMAAAPEWAALSRFILEGSCCRGLFGES